MTDRGEEGTARAMVGPIVRARVVPSTRVIGVIAILGVMVIAVIGTGFFLDDLLAVHYRRQYHCEYFLWVNWTMESYRIIVPVVTARDGAIISAVDYEGLGGNLTNITHHEVVESPHGAGLSIEATGDILLTLRGTFEVENDSRVSLLDMGPRLSMSSFDRDAELWRADHVLTWAFSSVEGLEVLVYLKVLGEDWIDGYHSSGHLSDGVGYGHRIVGYTRDGWREFPLDVHFLIVNGWPPQDTD